MKRVIVVKNAGVFFFFFFSLVLYENALLRFLIPCKRTNMNGAALCMARRMYCWILFNFSPRWTEMMMTSSCSCVLLSFLGGKRLTTDNTFCSKHEQRSDSVRCSNSGKLERGEGVRGINIMLPFQVAMRFIGG